MHSYFIIYKPYYVLSQFSPEPGKQTLSDFFDVPKDVYPVGRLDYDSEGLLMLTNDRKINQKLLDPSFAHEREYWVQVDGAITQQALEQLAHGVDINLDGKIYKTKRAHAEIFRTDPVLPARNPPIRFRKEIPAPWIRLVITEGKNRQVRKMTAKVGFPTLRLFRYRIQSLTLDNCLPGDMISLTAEEVYKNLFHE